MVVSSDNIIKSFFLFTLVNITSITNELYPKQLFKFIKNNVWVQHLFTLFLIFFSIELISEKNEASLNNFYNALITYVGYILFSKSTLFFSILILFLLSILFIIIQIKDTEDNSQGWQLAEQIIGYFTLAILLLSFVLYMYKQETEKGEKFTLYNFFFLKYHK